MATRLESAPAAPASATDHGRLLGLTQSDHDPASRVRLIQFIPFLEELGWSVEHRPNRPDRQWRSPLKNRLLRGLHYRTGRTAMRWNRLRDIRAAAGYDVVFVNRDLAGGAGRFERRLWRANPRIVFDFDDAIYMSERNERLVRWMCEHAAWITPGNPTLAEWSRQYSSRVTVIPTVIDTDRCRPAEARPPAPIRVGWTGSDSSIRATLFPYLELLADLQKRLSFELVVISNTRPDIDMPELRWRFHPWSVEGEAELGERFDIGIMPLVDDAFQRGKCGLKLLQYMAAGLPTVASPVGVNRDILVEGVTGYSASSPREWHRALEALLESAERRRSMGAAGRRRCEEEYSIRRWLPTLHEILVRVANSPVPGSPPDAPEART